MAGRLDIALKEADHVQAVLARYDQGLIALKTGYFAFLFAVFSGELQGGFSEHRVEAFFAGGVFFWVMDFGLRCRFWSSWATRATQISANLNGTDDAYALIGKEPKPLTAARRAEMSFNWPDVIFYFGPAIAYAIAAHCFGWS